MTTGRRTPPEPATDRVRRLLTMVPWLVSRQGITVSEAAEGLGVSEAQLKDDLDLLFMTGYGSMTDELIEVSYEHDRVYVNNAEAISRPLRLGVDEAVSIVVGLRSLSASGVASGDAIERALAKIEAATSEVAGLERVHVAPDDTVDAAVLATAGRGLRDRRRLHLTYVVPSRDERTERDVDPMRVVALDGYWYLEGWCHRARDTRLFRLDRVEEIEVLDVDGTPPAGATSRDLTQGSYVGGEHDAVVTLRLRPAARWVADYYPVLTRDDDGDDLVVTMTARDHDWLTRLVLRCGGGAVVESPEAAVLAVRTAARSALRSLTP